MTWATTGAFQFKLHLFGERSRTEGGQVAGDVAYSARQLPDRGLAAGDAVEVAHDQAIAGFPAIRPGGFSKEVRSSGVA